MFSSPGSYPRPKRSRPEAYTQDLLDNSPPMARSHGIGLLHRQRVGALKVAEGADRYVVGAVLLRRERHPGVFALAAVVVLGAGNLVAVRIKDPAQIRVPQGTAPGCLSLQVDLVGARREVCYLEPVAVLGEIDLACGRTSDRHRPGRAAVGRVLIGMIVHDINDPKLVAARLERLTARRYVVGAVILRRERHPEQVVGA